MREKIFIDPTFLRQSSYSYVNYHGEELATVLCFALARNKKDLILHQQRIELHAKNQNNNLLFTAIIDLFIALENKGEEYKKRVLNKHRGSLNSEQTLFLTKAIIQGVLALDSINHLNQSILNFGNSGKLLTTDMIGVN